MEECEPIPESISIILENLNHEIISYMRDMECNGVDFSDNSNFDEYYTKEDALTELIKYLWEDDRVSDKDWKYFQKINLIDQFKDMKEELQSIGFTKLNLDIHYNNVMLKKNTNVLCLIDFLSPKNFITE
jgi:hypothetical protein